MLVYMVEAREGWMTPRFHKSPGCTMILRHNSVAYEVNLMDVRKAEPCRRCYRTAPKTIKTWHPWCPECNKSFVYPCEHNGGVLVRVHSKPSTGPQRRGGSLRGYRLQYVWPESARYYEPVELAQPSTSS